MSSELIRVFKCGQGTFLAGKVVNGKSVNTIYNQGRGVFVDKPFTSLEDAKAFCEAELRRNERDVFHVLDGELIVTTVLSRSYHDRKERQFGWIYGCSSFLVVSALAFWLCLGVAPFQAYAANLLLACAISGFYLLALWVYGTHNIEAAVVTAIILVLLALLLPSCKKARLHHKGAQPSSVSISEVRHLRLS